MRKGLLGPSWSELFHFFGPGPILGPSGSGPLEISTLQKLNMRVL